MNIDDDAAAICVGFLIWSTFLYHATAYSSSKPITIVIENEINLEHNGKRLSLQQKIEIVRYYYKHGENAIQTADALTLVFGDTFQGCLK